MDFQNKRQKIQKGQSKMDNIKKLAKQGTQGDGKENKNKNTTQYVLDTAIHKHIRLT